MPATWLSGYFLEISTRGGFVKFTLTSLVLQSVISGISLPLLRTRARVRRRLVSRLQPPPHWERVICTPLFKEIATLSWVYFWRGGEGGRWGGGEEGRVESIQTLLWMGFQVFSTFLKIAWIFGFRMQHSERAWLFALPYSWWLQLTACTHAGSATETAVVLMLHATDWC